MLRQRFDTSRSGGSQGCERSSAVTGQDQNANDDNSDDAQKERKHLPVMGIWTVTRIVLFVRGHGPTPWPPSIGQRSQDACVPDH